MNESFLKALDDSILEKAFQEEVRRGIKSGGWLSLQYFANVERVLKFHGREDLIEELKEELLGQAS